MTLDTKKPIAYIVPIGAGLESFVYREIEALNDKGEKIILFATKYVKGDIYSPKDDWPCYSLPVKRLVLELPWLLLRMLSKPKLFLEAISSNSIIDLVFATKYSPIMRRNGIRQIHCHFGDHKLFIGYYCKRLTGLPLSVTIHSHELHANPNEKMFKIAIKKCDRLFAISELAVDILVNRYGLPKDRVVLSKLSLDPDVWNEKAPVRVVTVGRFQPQKGFDYLFKAIKLLADENVEFIIVGFGPLDVRAMAKETGVDKKIMFFNKLDQAQLRFMYQSCDIYCLPSITHPEQGKEGIPVVLMEAMACGLPVVATDAGAVNELVEQYLVEEKSPEALAEALAILIHDPALRKQQGERNISIVREKHNLENTDNFASMLQSLQN